MKTTKFLVVALGLIVFAGAAGPVRAEPPERRLNEDGLPLTTCPGAHSREPLLANRITTTPPVFGRDRTGSDVQGDLSRLTEGGNLLLDCDSYPRRPATLAGEPVCRARQDGYAISFRLSMYDDVAVRAVDARGNVLHTIACGVLGPNAPAPFQKDSLEQTILWDGRNAAGEPVEGLAEIEVAVGLRPVFERFVGYRDSQLSPYLNALTVDAQGRLYVGLHTAHRYDPSILRFDRQGSYIDMVYPSDPDSLARLGRRWEDIYDFVEYVDGYPTPVKPSLWRAWIEHWDDFVRFPFAIGPDNRGYMIIGMPNGSGTPLSLNARGDVDRLDVIEDLDDFWYWPCPGHVGVYPPMYLQRHDAGFAFEGDGGLLLAAKPHGSTHGPRSFGRYSGTVRRVDLRTGENVASFTKGPGNSEDAPTCLLRPAWSFKPDKAESSYIDRMQRLVIYQGRDLEPDPQFDSPDRFCDIEDITVDADGNILVADGYPRRIKCYAKDGEWLGKIEGLSVGGRMRRFHDLVSLRAVGEYLYLLSSFRDDRGGPVHLVKCEGRAPEFSVVWSVPLDPLARYIAVDTLADPNIVWVGNGGGPATVTRLVDNGESPAEPANIGGINEAHLVDPATICVDRDRNCYVYDKAREAVLKYDAEGRPVAHLDLNPNTMAAYYARYRRFPFQGDQYSAYADGTRYFFQSVFGMVADPRRDRVWMHYDANPNFKGWLDSYGEGRAFIGQYPPLVAYDRELRAVQADLFSPEGLEPDEKTMRMQVAGRAPRNINGVTEDGSLLCRVGVNRRPGADRFGGSISALDEQGEYRTLCRLFHGANSMTVDSRGNMYTVDGPSWPEAEDGWGFRFDYTFPTADMGHWALRTAEGAEAYSRGETVASETFEFEHKGKLKRTREAAEHIVRHKAEVAYLVKFGPEGGDRGTQQEQWALRGAYFGQVCFGCDTPRNLLACDGADRLILGDVDHNSVKVVDTAGNLVARFGRFGNAATVPGPDGDADHLGFRNIYSVAAAGEYAYICDRDLRRVAEVRMAYRATKRCRPPD